MQAPEDLAEREQREGKKKKSGGGGKRQEKRKTECNDGAVPRLIAPRAITGKLGGTLV